jgi:ABC-type phosphonate transport system ATPase subunit
MKTRRDNNPPTEERDMNSADRKTINTEMIAATAKGDPELRKTGESHKTDERELSPLFSDETERELRTQWHVIQTGFVDEPRRSVEQADELVAKLMQQLAQSFSDQRKNLERQWDKAEKISTEDLRLALRRYRSFFERLLSI